MALDSLYKADLLADLIARISADTANLKVENRQEHNDALLEILGGSSVASLTEIGDFPNSYTGYAGWILAVTPAEDGVTFIDPSTFLTAVAVDGVSIVGDGTVGSPLQAVSSGATFLALADTPATYPGAGYMLQVNPGNSGLEFVAPGLDVNFSNTDLTFAANRTHDIGASQLQFTFADAPDSGNITWKADIGYIFQHNTEVLHVGAASSIVTLTGGPGNIGAAYAADYSANYTLRSLVDKEYSDNWSFYLSDGIIDDADRTVTIFDTLTFQDGATYLIEDDTTNIARRGNGVNSDGYGSFGTMDRLSTATQWEGWGGFFMSGANPVYQSVVWDTVGGLEQAGQYYALGNFGGTDRPYWAGYYRKPTGEYIGFEANTFGERIYSQAFGLNEIALNSSDRLVYLNGSGSTGYIAVATWASVAALIPITLAQVLTNGNVSGGTNIDMQGASIILSDEAGDIQSISTSGGDIIINSDAYRLWVQTDSGLQVDHGITLTEGIIGWVDNPGVPRINLGGNTNSITWTTGGFTGNLSALAQTANNTWQLPDQSGTIALLSDITITGNGIYDGSGALSGATTVTLSAANSLTFAGGTVSVKGADNIFGTTAFLVTNLAGDAIIKATNDGTVKVGQPITNTGAGSHAFRSLNPTSNATDGSAFSVEASNGVVVWDVSAAGGSRVLGTLSVSDSTLDAQVQVITNSGTTAGVFHNVGAAGIGHAIEALAEDNVAIVAEVNLAGNSRTSLWANENVVIGGTKPVGGVSGTSRLQVTGSSTGTEWGIETKDGSGTTGFSINNQGVGVARNYTVAGVPTSVAGGIIYVTNESGGATLAYGDGVTWRRIYDNAIIS